MHGQSQRPAARLAGRPPRPSVIPYYCHSRTKYQLRRQRPRQEEIAGKANQGASRRLTAMPCASRQGQAAGKLAGATREGPRQSACRGKAATLHPNSSASSDVSPQGHPRSTWRGVAQPCGARWRAELTRRPSWRTVAHLTVVSLHCWGDRTGIKCPCPLLSELGRGHCW